MTKNTKNILSRYLQYSHGVDESGKDIARACFESYDPDIYVNLDAENFIIDYDVIPFETNEVGSITNIKVIDTDEIANKLMTWFKKKYNSVKIETPHFTN
jgi:hypothetical protein